MDFLAHGKLNLIAGKQCRPFLFRPSIHHLQEVCRLFFFFLKKKAGRINNLNRAIEERTCRSSHYLVDIFSLEQEGYVSYKDRKEQKVHRLLHRCPLLKRLRGRSGKVVAGLGDFEQTPAYSARARSPHDRLSAVSCASCQFRQLTVCDVPDEHHQLPEQKWPLSPPVSAHSHLPSFV